MQQGHKMAEQVRPPISLTNAVSWRSEGIIHKKNEIFLDIVEKLNLLVASNGTVLRSEIIGAVKMKSFLSGMPELKLGACFPKFFVLTTMKYFIYTSLLLHIYSLFHGFTLFFFYFFTKTCVSQIRVK